MILELTARLSKREGMLFSLPGMTSGDVDKTRQQIIEQQASKIKQLETELLESAERNRLIEDEIQPLRENS